MTSEPEPEPATSSKSKGELRRLLILSAIQTFIQTHQRNPKLQDIQEITGSRSFNTLTRHLTLLKKEGVIDWDHNAASISLNEDTTKV